MLILSHSDVLLSGVVRGTTFILTLCDNLLQFLKLVEKGLILLNLVFVPQTAYDVSHGHNIVGRTSILDVVYVKELSLLPLFNLIVGFLYFRTSRSAFVW